MYKIVQPSSISERTKNCIERFNWLLKKLLNIVVKKRSHENTIKYYCCVVIFRNKFILLQP
jgi:hypothetical protein